MSLVLFSTNTVLSFNGEVKIALPLEWMSVFMLQRVNLESHRAALDRVVRCGSNLTLMFPN
jgi:hypothetical protein